MATKWKNIIETGKRLLKQHWQVLVSVMLAGCGIFTFYILIAYRTYYPTEKILYFGILGNILLGSGTAYLLEKGLNRKYQNWIPKEDAYYRDVYKRQIMIPAYQEGQIASRKLIEMIESKNSISNKKVIIKNAVRWRDSTL